jgi:hypothetical protein
MIKSFCLLACVVGSSIFMAAQSQTTPPGNMTLLPGYQHERRNSMDSQPGRIWADKLVIDYDIGNAAGNWAYAARSRGNLLWTREQIVGGARVEVAFTRERKLIVTFAGEGSNGARSVRKGDVWVLPANFSAVVNRDEDIADVLLMLMTYKP